MTKKRRGRGKAFRAFSGLGREMPWMDAGVHVPPTAFASLAADNDVTGGSRMRGAEETRWTPKIGGLFEI